ncbi:hypothetical protein [Microbacterium sp. NIBRBAC000506063]|uniref:hypothetical protein n=1 Tax=Microbacterium sp. NIBRBAC000506063 TaxID=2734618 RepID=UPI001BB791BA|nr:hypothetical protein [Microbacterium sp. NIBRBAC000506063]QTV78948.1 hypothetical protein KAE78_07020 [Microbacterium sp. NIBRBAC000506063]
MVLDLQVIRRSASTAPYTWTIGGLHAGRNLDVLVLGTLVGRTPAPFTAHEIQDDVYQAPGANYGGTVNPTGRYSTYFYCPTAPWDRQCSNPFVPFSYTDAVLIAFGDDTASVDSHYVFTDVAAGEILRVQHLATDTVVSFELLTDVDADLFSSQVPGERFSTSDGSGYIDLQTNGSIVSRETVGDLLVGTITSTGSDVTLSTTTAGASIFGNTPVADDHRVTGTVITLTAHGTIGLVAPTTPT